MVNFNKSVFPFVVLAAALIVQPLEGSFLANCYRVFGRLTGPPSSEYRRYDKVLATQQIHNQCSNSCVSHGTIEGLEAVAGVPLSTDALLVAQLREMWPSILHGSMLNIREEGSSGGLRLASKAGVTPQSAWPAKEGTVDQKMPIIIEELKVLAKKYRQLGGEPKERMARKDQVINEIDSVIRKYTGRFELGPFIYRGRSYTARTFAREVLGLSPERSICSFRFGGTTELKDASAVSTLVDNAEAYEPPPGGDGIETKRLDSMDDFDQVIKWSIDSGRPVLTTYEHKAKYINPGTGVMRTKLPPIARSGDPLTGSRRNYLHYVAIIGYAKGPEGRLERYLIQDHTGPEFGDNGNRHMYRDYAQRFLDEITVLPRPNSTPSK